MSTGRWLPAAAIFAAAVTLVHIARSQEPLPFDDPLRHGHALLIGVSHYKDKGWDPLDDVPMQLIALQRGLENHFDSVEVVQDPTTEQLRQKIMHFLRYYGNDISARLLIYYA